jgi:chromosome segregation and condensation protein ScpB
MWLMKRALVDGWNVDRALEEATLLGLTNEALKQFMLSEIQKRKSPGRH